MGSEVAIFACRWRQNSEVWRSVSPSGAAAAFRTANAKGSSFSSSGAGLLHILTPQSPCKHAQRMGPIVLNSAPPCMTIRPFSPATAMRTVISRWRWYTHFWASAIGLSLSMALWALRHSEPVSWVDHQHRSGGKFKYLYAPDPIAWLRTLERDQT